MGIGNTTAYPTPTPTPTPNPYQVGIGNTTAAAALLAMLTGAEPGDCCGRGTGLDAAGPPPCAKHGR